MRILITVLSLLIYLSSLQGQSLTRLTSLDSTVLESSGLVYLNNKLITHNDSGDEPAIYEIDTINGEVLRKVILRGATNEDWEDICADNKYIYVGDFGNNYGNRKDLKIYRLSISEYFAASNDTVDAEVINFSYKEQHYFKADPFYTNYDTEAIISYNDSLYIFTKNWGDLHTYIYSCPKIPGSYELSRIDEIDIGGVVTGSSYNATDQSIVLCGYIYSFPFMVSIQGFEGSHFSEGKILRYFLPLEGSTQIESIAYHHDQYFFSTEQNKKGASTLYKLSSEDLSEMKTREKQIGKSLAVWLISRVKNSYLFYFAWKSSSRLYL